MKTTLILYKIANTINSVSGSTARQAQGLLKTVDIRQDGSMVKLSKDRNNILSLFEQFGFRMVAACFPNDVNHSSRLATMYGFSRYLHQMYLHGGAILVVQYLKVGQLCIQKAIAGLPASSMKSVANYPFPDLARGLPRFIPSVDRGLILAGHPSVIRYWLTLFSVYRVIDLPGVLKLNTITDAPTFNQEEMDNIISQITKLWDPLMLDKSFLIREPDLLLLESASSGYPISLYDYYHSAFSLIRTPLGAVLEEYLRLMGYGQLLTIWRLTLTNQKLGELMNNRLDNGPSLGVIFGMLGKVAIKEEAAGKVRVFAMVDPWTQTILKPIHNMIFDLLERLPNDAMRDQQAAVQRCMAKAMIALKSFGYDLSAATDRLPAVFQEAILNIVHPTMGTLWKALMVDRDFGFYHKKYTEGKAIKIRYSTGQPMGAYSSWGMLALTHHLIVQLAAHRAGVMKGKISLRNWFSDYELLGDDVVIFNEDVAKHYLIIMESLGVPINQTKSVIASNATFEFAKVTGHKGHFVSALSWKAFMSQNTMMGRANIAYSLLNKGFVHKRLMPWIAGITRVSKWTTGNLAPTYTALLTMAASSGRIRTEEVMKLLVSPKVLLTRWYDSILLNFNLPLVSHILPKILKGEMPIIQHSPRTEEIWKMDKLFAMMGLWKPLEVFKSTCDPEQHALTLAIEQVVGNCSAWTKEDFDFITMDSSYPQLDWTPDQQDKWTLWYPWYRIFVDKLQRLSEFTGKLEGRWINPSFDDLLQFTDDCARYDEL